MSIIFHTPYPEDQLLIGQIAQFDNNKQLIVTQSKIKVPCSVWIIASETMIGSKMNSHEAPQLSATGIFTQYINTYNSQKMINFIKELNLSDGNYGVIAKRYRADNSFTYGVANPQYMIVACNLWEFTVKNQQVKMAEIEF